MKAQLPQHEHEFEAAPGLPEPLPPGERLLWQGTPDWRVLAVEALHVRKVAIYFGVLTAWRVAIVAGDDAGLLATTKAALWMLLLAGAAIGLLSAVAWFMARNSLYTVTDKRVVMRVGVVLSVTFNLPFKAITAAALRRGAGGHGDISLALAGPDRIAYLHLWPHARPWQIKQPQPMMRALPQAQAVAAFLAAELAQSAAQTPIAVSLPHRPRQTTQTPGFDRLGPNGMESPMGMTS